MAKFRVLTKEDIENGTYPRTPKEKVRRFKAISIVLSIIVIAQQVALIYLATKK